MEPITLILVVYVIILMILLCNRLSIKLKDKSMYESLPPYMQLYLDTCIWTSKNMDERPCWRQYKDTDIWVYDKYCKEKENGQLPTP